MNFLDDLNTEQRLAVEAGNGPVVIVAGPGTGKTKTLTARIAHLIANGAASPDHILAITFTKKAAEEMRARVRRLLNGARCPRILTFHAFCHQWLGASSEAPLQFVNEPERLMLIRQLSCPASLKHLSVRERALYISRAKNTLEPPDAFVQAYNAALHERGVYDFDDLLLMMHEQLQDPIIRERIAARFQHVLVDEFQDTNLLQYELLRALSAHQNLFVIGDPLQSIYGFRGASGDIFERFQHDFPQHQKVVLEVNYRSVPQVVALSNALFKEQTLQAHSTQGGYVRALKVLNEYSEAEWVLSAIQAEIGGGDFLSAVSDGARQDRRLSDFAILYRSRAAAMTMQRRIAESGLPYQVVGEGSPYESPEVSTLITLLRAFDTAEPAIIKNFSVMQCQHLLNEVHGEGEGTALDIATRIIVAFNLPQSKELAQILAVIVQFTTVQDFLSYVDELSVQHFFDPRADAITLLTIHAAKGLEFPYVFLVGAEDGILPHAKADKEEERRLFYVAVTRAKERLDMLYCLKRAGKPVRVSSFISELPEGVVTHITDPELASQQRRAIRRQQKRSQTTLF